MTPDEIAEADRLAAKWEPNPAECEIEGAQAENWAMSASGQQRKSSRGHGNVCCWGLSRRTGNMALTSDHSGPSTFSLMARERL